MIAEIIAIGDEIVSGQTLDTNSQWLSLRLEELGVKVLFHSTVGDELEPNVDIFRRAIDRADIIVATGGLGPTADDLTRQALAEATGRELYLDQKALQEITDFFARRNRQMPPQNKLQALFPEGSRIIPNPHGTAPGIDLEVPRNNRCPARVICLPGVPAEMIEMWNNTVAIELSRFIGNGRVVRRKNIHCFGAGESQIEAMLPDMIRRGHRPTVGITASQATITLRIVADGKTEQECNDLLEQAARTIRDKLGTLVFGEDEEQLQHAVLKLLAQQEKTLATVECGTAGIVAEWLASAKAYPQIYRGGIVLTECSQPLENLAVDCKIRFTSDVVLVVGPVVDEKIELAIASANEIKKQIIIARIHPALTRIFYAKSALNLLRLELLGEN